MAKKGGKLFAVAALGAAAAGAYYYLKKKNETIPTDMEDEDDIDNFDADVDDAPSDKSKRSYTSLDFATVEQKVTDAANKVADAANKAASTIGSMLKQGEERVEEFFDDRKTEAETSETPAEDTEEKAEEAAEEAPQEEAPLEGEGSGIKID